MSQVIERAPVVGRRGTSYVHVACHIEPETVIECDVHPEGNRVVVGLGDCASPGEVNVFLQRDQLTRFIAVLVRAGVELGDSVDALVGGA